MAERVSTSDWLRKSRASLRNTRLAPVAETVGSVARIADGIARVTGLPDAALGTMLRFPGCRYGFAHGLGADDIDVVMLDDCDAVEAGDQVTDTGEVLRVPVGDKLLGRIVDPLGRPLDGGPDLDAEETHPVDRPAPAIVDRDLVSEPVETGILVIDSMFSLGRGQRELLIGDRTTGKTALAIDVMVNQKNSGMICIYVAVGQRAAAVERVIATVREHGNAERCIFVIGASSSAPGLQWIAPFAGMTMAEYFRDRGQHALIVIDDLTQHAVTHRELALLTREPPGREAYPGDVFYLHARLLERAAKLAPDLGGGSLTALPIAETEEGNLSAYIPTNLISITDGQIVLNSHLFAASHRPAVDVGLSVSRVGGKAQWPALRDVSGRIRLDYAQFQELEMFTRFGGITNASVRAQIARGERIRALLNQPRYAGLRLADQVALLVALADGLLDGVAVQRIPELRRRLPGWLDKHAVDTVARLQASGRLGPADRAQLSAAVAAIAVEFAEAQGGAG